MREVKYISLKRSARAREGVLEKKRKKTEGKNKSSRLSLFSSRRSPFLLPTSGTPKNRRGRQRRRRPPRPLHHQPHGRPPPDHDQRPPRRPKRRRNFTFGQSVPVHGRTRGGLPRRVGTGVEDDQAGRCGVQGVLRGRCGRRREQEEKGLVFFHFRFLRI